MPIIVLTAEEANKVRCKPSRFAALEPIPYKDGMYILGEEVLNDPVYWDKKTMLYVLPRLDEATVKAETQSIQEIVI